MKKICLLSFLILVFISLANAQGTLDSLLVVSLPFNENALDESGNENHGIVTGATLVEDRFGNANSAYLFNTVTDVITIPYSNSLEFTNQITLAAWINVESKELPYLGRIIVKNAGSYPSAHPFGMYHGKANFISAQISGYTDEYDYYYTYIDTESIITPDSIVKEFEWEHVVTTWDSDSLKIYINCDLAVALATDIVQNFNSTEHTITIGNSDTDGPPTITGILGEIDDVRIYARAITQEEVRMLGDCETITHINELNNPSVDLFPNPAFDRLNIIGLPYGAKINIYNSFGQTTKSLTYDGQTIDVSSIKTGIYFIQSTLNGKILISKRFLKK